MTAVFFKHYADYETICNLQSKGYRVVRCLPEQEQEPMVDAVPKSLDGLITAAQRASTQNLADVLRPYFSGAAADTMPIPLGSG